MSKYSQTVIPTILITNYRKYNLTEEELLLIIQLKSINDLKINLIQFLEKFEVSKLKVNQLLEKKIITLDEIEGVVFIDMTPLHEKIYSTNESEVSNKNEVLSVDDIDKLKYIFNRELKPYELEKIKGWMNNGNSFEEIEQAIYKALVKNVTNLNYIQAILENKIDKNNDQSNNSNEQNIVRNWTFE